MASSIDDNLYLSCPKDRQRAYKLWERFQTADHPGERLAGPYERMLYQEWARCRKFGVDPSMRQGHVLSAAEFEALQQDKSFLLEKAKPSLDKISELLRGVPGIVIFTDEQGTILYIVGDVRVRTTAAEASKIVEGSRWLESLAGTNGIGTAIARRSPVHVFSTEHFCEGWHRWTCAASPIIEPGTNKLLGVVDFTTLDKDYREDAVALTHSLARSICAELLLQLEVERMQLVHGFSVYSSRYPSDEITVVDRLNRVVRSSGVARATEKDLACGGEDERGGEEEKIDVCISGSEGPIGRLLLRRRKDLPLRFSGRAVAGGAVAFGEFVSRNPGVKRIMERVDKIIPTALNVLLVGETGTGKELVSRYIHEQSPRRSAPFVAVNCGMISRELFESTFFGYERGAFTGADTRGKKGLFEAARGGTLFLDEIGELPTEIQAGLLRVLETGRFRRVSSSKELEADCRIIAATNRDLLEEMKHGSFRSDLYYRLSVATFVLPPLRERLDDVPILIDHIAANFCRKNSLRAPSFTEQAVDALVRYPWPGNVRELRNVLESTIICAGDPVDVYDLPDQLLGSLAETTAHPLPEPATPEELAAVSSDPDLSMRAQERRLLVCALAKYGNVCHVAKAVGVSRSKLYRMFKAFDIDHTRYLSEGR
ncbi:MAG: sigma-54-dependent Fis family transcriptional regulator [Deltaproteobacteria bacterium]|nr:sigma-54-dependent Fis family transcriptional regulator [Deltaproteobacteria bacterium]